jgi:hypothetical protein
MELTQIYPLLSGAQLVGVTYYYYYSNCLLIFGCL